MSVYSRALLLAMCASLPFGVPGAAQERSLTGVTPSPSLTLADTPRVRRRAIQYSEAYNTRLTIHRIGSYTMLPLFAGEWLLGDQLLNGVDPPGWMKPAHSTVAATIGVLFTINTVTGGWNLWDSRADPAGRPRRYLHTGLMLASDAGFAWAAAIAGDGKHDHVAAKRHRNVALGSIGLSTIGTAMMWLWKD